MAGELNTAREPLLVQEGEAPLELASIDAATAALSQPGEEQAGAQETGETPLVVPGRRPGSWLLRLDGPWCQQESPQPGRARRWNDGEQPRGGCPTVLIGVQLPAGESGHELPTRLVDASGLPTRWTWALVSAAAMAVQVHESSVLLNDALTGVPGRAEFFATLERAMRRAHDTALPFALLFVNPDEFMSVNDRFGREAGDRALRELVDVLRASCRTSDSLARYGGAIFALLLPDTPGPAAREVAEKARARLCEQPLLDGALRLGFSVGVVSYDPAVRTLEAPVDVVRQAHQALSAAKRAGGNATCVWTAEAGTEELRNLDRLTGMFTGDVSKDYRNMSLLWEVVSAMAGAADFPALAGEVVERLFAALRARQVAVVERVAAARYETVDALLRRSGGSDTESVERRAQLGPRELGLLEESHRERRTIRASLPPTAADPAERQACCVPLVSAGRVLGALYLDGPAESFRPDSSDLMFLDGLAAPLAVARDRSLMAEQERRREAERRRALESELEGLKRSLRSTRLLYSSEPMESLLEAASRVAPTDATVLITGESGTGKELLARTIHDISPRRQGPFVVVDCGAIPPTLADSELFGHERGAYTGADSRRVGRLAEAEGGTVVLDEIGELPLDVQSRLLRFVQERQVTPVGGGRPRPVNARLLAATHRDLRADVASGRFRQDLFYRLNVVHLEVPPLRERASDVLHLASHYVASYAQLYRRPARRLSPEGEAAALRHAWPGNVRELQNRIMQAVILCDGEQIGAGELGLAVEPAAAASLERGAAEDAAECVTSDAARVWSALREELARVVREAVAGGARGAPPLGQWLEEDLVLEAHAAADGVLRRAASRLGVPEATYRRRYEQAARARAAGSAVRRDSWAAVRALLSGVAQLEARPDCDHVDACARALLDVVRALAPDDVRFRSALLGITPPTYRRRVAAKS